MNKPVDTQEFWKHRLYQACATGRGVHTAVYDIDQSVWEEIQKECIGVLKRYIRAGDKVLDVGCGYGALCGCLSSSVNYIGIDVSPDLIEVARLAYPTKTFHVVDARDLPFKDNSFDWVIARSLRDMIVDNLGEDYWNRIECEMLRVSSNVLLIEFENGVSWKTLQRR